MHELALMEDLVSTVRDHVGEAVRVVSVKLVIGDQSCVAPASLSFCFDLCAQGTALEGATLQIEVVSGQALRVREVEVV